MQTTTHNISVDCPKHGKVSYPAAPDFGKEAVTLFCPRCEDEGQDQSTKTSLKSPDTGTVKDASNENPTDALSVGQRISFRMPVAYRMDAVEYRTVDGTISQVLPFTKAYFVKVDGYDTPIYCPVRNVVEVYERVIAKD